jgi:hypothetical protein
MICLDVLDFSFEVFNNGSNFSLHKTFHFGNIMGKGLFSGGTLAGRREVQAAGGKSRWCR